MNIRYQGSPDTLKTLYEALGRLQEEITNEEGFEGRNDFREDWRGWKYDLECRCTRCPRMGEEFHEKLRKETQNCILED